MPSARILLLATAAALLPAAAFAHAELTSAVPTADSVAQGSPPLVELTMSEGVEAKFSHITVKDATGKRVDKNDLHTVADAKHLAISLNNLNPGHYVVTWNVTATDTHKTSGQYGFDVAQ